MVNIYLCDDNPQAVEQYAGLIRGCAEKYSIEVTLSIFYSGEALIFHLHDIPHRADVIYLNVLMEDANGIEIAKRLRESGCTAEIIFLSAVEDYVYEAFDVNAMQYLLKGDTFADKFEQTFLRAVSLTSGKEKEMFFCEFDNVKRVIPVQQISYFEIWRRVITVHFGDDTAKFYGTLESLEQQLAHRNFVRVHRSYLVHLPYISQFQAQGLELKNGEKIPIGVTYLMPLKKTFSAYISRTSIYTPIG